MKRQFLSLLISMLIIIPNLSYAQIESLHIEVSKVSENIYKFFIDDFVNMVAFLGPNGILLVDTGFEENIDEVKSILNELGNSEIKYIINTHSDYDHIAGNRSLRGNALVIVHENCRNQMLKYIDPLFDIPFDKKIFAEGLPMITLKDHTVIHFNGEEIHIIPLLGGHTDEDIIVYFKNSGVLCVGDIIFPYSFPQVKVENGGSIQTLMANLETLINNFSKDVILIAGHGAEMNVKQLDGYRRMIIETTDIVHDAIKEGKDVEEMKKDIILKNWKSWNSKMFPEDLNTGSWIESLYNNWHIENPNQQSND